MCSIHREALFCVGVRGEEGRGGERRGEEGRGGEWRGEEGRGGERRGGERRGRAGSGSSGNSTMHAI